ncbi:hypothetical protein SAMN04487830_12227 [Pseudobutyrivibrio sp. OR37]|uniref:hypothetical protein n=1 Tax=Pseudobutyrivibrio sp. OR37 TaxID=1798186 RepID=UPI0008E185D4|nr:hypothetical protein [Pseudobutyrivibrio sp. OR37]SFI09794.1 hypothetical protein SAMN04487830_12227 [Pseudobutyrivibrio sp. OR37]
MEIKVIVAKQHEKQLENETAARIIKTVEEQLNANKIEYQENTINYIYLDGLYQHKNRSMLTAGVFLNALDKKVTAIKGTLRLKYKNESASIAKAMIDFDNEYMGELNPGEALYFEINIPVKGLSEDKEFKIVDIEGTFEDVIVHY